MRNYAVTDEAKATRMAREQLQWGQRDDPLAKRQWLIAFWRKCAIKNKAYEPHNGAWWAPFLINFRCLLMPGVRLRLDACDKAHEEQRYAELIETAKRWRQKKAERVAEKRRIKQMGAS